MNKTGKWILLAVIFVLVIVGAVLLYQTLSKEYQTDGLVPNATLPTVDNTEVPGKPDGTDGTNATKPSKPKPNVPKAMDFTVYDKDGNPVRLSDMKGKIVVLNFWATWCPYCRMEMPDFQKVYQKMDDEVVFMMVNMTNGRETLEKAKDFIADNEYTFPVYFDTEMQALRAYQAYTLPATYFIDKDQNIVAHAMGALNKDSIIRGINIVKEFQREYGE